MGSVYLFFISLLTPPATLAFAFYGFKKYPGHWKRFFPLFFLAFATLAYAYNPIGTPDLVRYFEMLDVCSTLTLSEVFRWFDDGLFVKNVVFWLVAHLKTYHLLPAITTGITYGVICYITCDSAIRLNCTKHIGLVLLFQIGILPYITIVCNVRNIVAFSLIILAVYRDTVQNRKNIVTLLLYVFPCFVHNTGFILIAFRVVALFSITAVIVAGVFAVISPVLIVFAYHNSSFLGSSSATRIVRRVITNAYWYMQDTDTSDWARAVAKSGAQHLNRYILMAAAVFLIVLLLWVLLKKKKEIKEFQTFSVFVLIICVFTLACNIFTIPAYWRFSAASFIASGFILNFVMNNYKRFPTYIKTVWLLLCGVMLIKIPLQVWMARLDVDLVDFISNGIITNIYVILYEVFRGLLLW